MTSETRDLVTWVLGTAIALAMLVGMAVRFVLMPYLRENLVKPIAQVEKQVTENSHANQVPTVLDRIDDVHTEVRTLARVLDGHMASGDDWLVSIMDRLDRLERRSREE